MGHRYDISISLALRTRCRHYVLVNFLMSLQQLQIINSFSKCHQRIVSEASFGFFPACICAHNISPFVMTDCNTCNILMCLQIGQWDYKNRQQFLQDNYSFTCQCSGCTKVNFPDLVLNAFRCANPNCSGVVLDDCFVEYEKHKFCHLQETPKVEYQREVCISV